jgi:hypothetical protein
VGESTTDNEQLSHAESRGRGGWPAGYSWNGIEAEKVSDTHIAPDGGQSPRPDRGDLKGHSSQENGRGSAHAGSEGEHHRSEGGPVSSKLPPRPPAAPSVSGETGPAGSGGVKHARQDSAEAALNPGCHMRQESLDGDFALHDDATNHDFGALYADMGGQERPTPNYRRWGSAARCVQSDACGKDSGV